jgi:hypothetical protein
MCQPAAPDYAAAATAQGAANVTAAQNQATLNNPNITSPYGTQTVNYTTGPNGMMQPDITQQLTPAGQQDVTAQQQVQLGEANLANQGLGTAQSIMGSPFQYNGPGIQTGLPSVGQAQTSADMSGVAPAAINPGTTAYQAQMNLLQPQITQQQNALTQQLQNQGIPIGSDAYNNAMRAEGNQIGSLEDQAAVQGVGLQQSANQQGYQQALGNAGLYNSGVAQNYQQALGSGQFGNTAAQQALSQQLGLYNQPLNEITALMSGSQIQSPQFQQYTGGGTIGAAPVMQAAVNQGNYNTAAYNSQMSGLGGLFGGAGDILGGTNPLTTALFGA